MAARKPKAAAKLKAAAKAKATKTKAADAAVTTNTETAPVDQQASHQVQPSAEVGAATAAAAPAGPPAELQDGFKPGEFFVRVRGPKRGRWRAGRQFGREPVFIDAVGMTGRDRDLIYDDPQLACSVVTAAEKAEEEDPAETE